MAHIDGKLWQYNVVLQLLGGRKTESFGVPPKIPGETIGARRHLLNKLDARGGLGNSLDGRKMEIDLSSWSTKVKDEISLSSIDWTSHLEITVQRHFDRKLQNGLRSRLLCKLFLFKERSRRSSLRKISRESSLEDKVCSKFQESRERGGRSLLSSTRGQEA